MNIIQLFRTKNYYPFIKDLQLLSIYYKLVIITDLQLAPC